MSKIGIISDVHGNYLAFDKAIDILSQNGVQEFIFLGDAVGYIPSPLVLYRLIELGSKVRCVIGNHEAMLLRNSIDAEKDKIYKLTEVRRALLPEHIHFINSWSKSLSLLTERYQMLFLHGSPDDPTYGYIYPDSDLEAFDNTEDYIFMGNSHYPFIRYNKNTCFINVGSCGLPRDDGRYGSCVIFDTESGEAEIIRFDISIYVQNILGSFDVHESVISLYKRRKKNIIGEIVG